MRSSADSSSPRGATGTKRRPKWWLDLHNYLGGLAFAFVIVHIVTVYQDQLSGIGLLQVFVPMTASGWAWGITWGVLATYVFALVVFTSWPRKRGSRRVWLSIHLMSGPAAIGAGVHAWMVGSSKGQLWFSILLVALTGLAVYPAVLRLLAAVTKHSSRRTQRPASAVPVATSGLTGTDGKQRTTDVPRRELVGSGPRLQ